MDDTIYRQAAIDALDEIEAEVADGYGYQYAKWREYFVEMPSAQPEIIRCKDCNKNYGSEYNPICDYMDAYLCPDSFCSYGERREE